MADFDIVGIGVCTVDHLMTVPHMPGRNVNMRAGHYLREAGGLASCALAAAARLGARTRIIGHVGDDDAGRFIRRDFEREGVDTSRLFVRAGSESHVSLILVDEGNGERSIMTRPATGESVRSDEIEREDITGARVLFVDDVSELTLHAVRWAREAGVLVVMDPARSYAGMESLLPWVDVPIVPEVWGRAWMPGESSGAVAAALHRAGARVAAVTMGAAGSVVCWSGGEVRVPAFAVDVVDTTGAGDAYHGGFMYALLQGWDVPRMARFASAVGSLNCRAMGGRRALPTRDEVERLLAGKAPLGLPKALGGGK